MPSQAVTVAAVIGEQSLKLLQEASKFVPVPGIGVAASLALGILQVALAADDNREEFTAIGRDACVIMVTIVQRVNRSATGTTTPMNMTDLQRDADSLEAEMLMIDKIVKKYAKRGFLKRMVFSAEETGIVQQCRARLDHALQLFGLQSDIELRQQMALLSDKMDKILDQAPQMPQPFAQSNLSSQSLQPTWPEQPTPSYPISPRPLSCPTPSQPLPYPPSPQSSPYTPSPQPEQSREERKAARRARRDERKAQQAISLSAVPPDSSFSNVQNHLSPSGSISYNYISGNATTNSRDDSFNVSGTGNSISISFAR